MAVRVSPTSPRRVPMSVSSLAAASSASVVSFSFRAMVAASSREVADSI
ncbi:MAG: hypothetical protein ACLUW6_05685 [Coriobacteriaceae bacterium]